VLHLLDPAARGRIKKMKHRLLTLDAPDPDKLTTAVRLGIADTISLFTEKPPKGSANNFGLTGLQYWARMLSEPKQRHSWAKLFPAGLPYYAGLSSAYEFAFLFGKGTAQDAERGLYADFLDEAAMLLDQPALRDTADRYRACAAAWGDLPTTLLPDAVTPFAEARQLMAQKHGLFLAQGGAALADIEATNGRLAAIRTAVQDDFPLTEAELVAHREQIAAQLLRIHDAEATAVRSLQAALGG